MCSTLSVDSSSGFSFTAWAHRQTFRAALSTHQLPPALCDSNRRAVPNAQSSNDDPPSQL